MEELVQKYIKRYGDYPVIRKSAYMEYLNNTDYVVIKISELMANGGNIENLKTEYADILAEREIARTRINELESEV